MEISSKERPKDCSRPSPSPWCPSALPANACARFSARNVSSSSFRSSSVFSPGSRWSASVSPLTGAASICWDRDMRSRRRGFCWHRPWPAWSSPGSSFTSSRWRAAAESIKPKRLFTSTTATFHCALRLASSSPLHSPSAQDTLSALKTPRCKSVPASLRRSAGGCT